MLTISNLKTHVSKILSLDFFYLSNIWSNDGSGDFNISIFGDSHNISSMRLLGIINFNGKGLIKSFKLINGDEYSNLNGKYINLSSFKYDYEKIIKTRPVGVEGCDIIGIVNDNGEAIVYSLEDYKQLKLPYQYHGNNEVKKDYKNCKVIDIYRELMSKYGDYLTSANIYDDGQKDYNFKFKIKGFSLNVTISCFFSYAIKLKIYNASGDLVIKSNGNQINSIYRFFEDIECGVFSKGTRDAIFFSQIRDLISFNSDKSDNVYNLEFSKVSGSIPLFIDFNSKTISLMKKTRSTKYIPNKVDNMNTLLKDFDHQSYVLKAS
jgi:hypothetical protein